MVCFKAIFLLRMINYYNAFHFSWKNWPGKNSAEFLGLGWTGRTAVLVGQGKNGTTYILNDALCPSACFYIQMKEPLHHLILLPLFLYWLWNISIPGVLQMPVWTLFCWCLCSFFFSLFFFFFFLFLSFLTSKRLLFWTLFEGAHVCKQNFMDCAQLMTTGPVSNACVS